MTTVRELRDRARELGIRSASRMRKVELLAAVTAALARIGPAPGSSAQAVDTRADVRPPVPDREAVRPARRHPHTGVGPLLGPLALPALPEAHEVRHLAVVPRNAHAAVVVWSLPSEDWLRGPLVLCVRAEEGLVARAPVGGRLGTHVVVGLRADQPVWAEILAGDEPVAVSRRTALPPDAPSRLYQPLLARIAVDRPLHALPRDLRAGRAAPTASGATASERSWLRAAGGAPTRLGETEHEALVSSLVHAVVR